MYKKLLIILVLYFITPCFALSDTIFGDFEGDWVKNPTGHNSKPALINSKTGIKTLPGIESTMEVFKDARGIDGGNCARVDVTAYGRNGGYKLYNQYHSDKDVVLAELEANTNRFSWYLLFPNWSSRQINLCPETESPLDTNVTLGDVHYYHRYHNVTGSPNYWIKFIADTHPQHSNCTGIKNGWRCLDPPNNPETNYMQRWRRNYIRFVYPPWGDNETWTKDYGPYSVFLDKQKFYVNPYPDNTETVTSVATAYYGSGDFKLYWCNDSDYGLNTDGANRWGYEIRHSKTPIMNISDYNSATLVSDAKNPFWDNAFAKFGWYEASFNIAGALDGSTYYFAISEVRRNPSDGFDSWDFTIHRFNN